MSLSSVAVQCPPPLFFCLINQKACGRCGSRLSSMLTISLDPNPASLSPTSYLSALPHPENPVNLPPCGPIRAIYKPKSTHAPLPVWRVEAMLFYVMSNDPSDIHIPNRHGLLLISGCRFKPRDAECARRESDNVNICNMPARLIVIQIDEIGREAAVQPFGLEVLG